MFQRPDPQPLAPASAEGRREGEGPEPRSDGPELSLVRHTTEVQAIEQGAPEHHAGHGDDGDLALDAATVAQRM
jgi:hypothetical protein